MTALEAPRVVECDLFGKPVSCFLRIMRQHTTELCASQ